MSIHISLGHHGFWGYSSSFDWNILFADSDSDVPLNILLVHPGDVRHILHTVARRRRTFSRLKPINFYLLETPMEVLSRDILLLEVLNDYEVPIRQRANIFLEIFGNCKVQDRTSRYIEQLGHQLRSLVASGTGRLEGIVDFRHLRYRDKDDMEEVFKSYSRAVPFDIDNLRDHRLRGFYAERYDSRASASDWDWYATFKPSASIVHVKQYKEWRMSGIAFEFGDQKYDQPNRTLMSYTEGFLKQGKDRGLKKEVKGFWGDIVASPYFSLGIDTDTPNKFASGLFEILNKDSGTEQHRHHAVEIAVHNLFSFLWEIETGKVYQLTKANDIFSGLGAEETDVVTTDNASDIASVHDQAKDLTSVAEDVTLDPSDDEDPISEIVPDADITHTSLVPIAESASEDDTASELAHSGDLQTIPVSVDGPSYGASERDELAKAIQRAECIVESWAGITIFPLFGSVESILSKEKFKDCFDAAFVSARAAQTLGSVSFDGVMKDNSIIAVENAKFMIPLSKSERETVNLKIDELASSHGWRKSEVAPVPRRRRDERDTQDDVFFYTKICTEAVLS